MFFPFSDKLAMAAALPLKSRCNMGDRKRVNFRVSRAVLAKHAAPICLGDWSSAQGNRAPPVCPCEGIIRESCVPVSVRYVQQMMHNLTMHHLCYCPMRVMYSNTSKAL